MPFRLTALLSAIAVLIANPVAAQSQLVGNGDLTPLRSAVQKAVDSNPEVTARFNAYRAATDAIDAGRAGYYPRLDLSAGVGRDRDRITTRSPASQSLNRNGAALTLSQLLWDGLATSNEVGRLRHEQMARYFEVLDATEQTALEAARAYLDVLRFRRLVELAEDNFVQHQSAYNQIQSRFKAGVGRGVDLEQAGARVALAESNLNTEVSNLYDVTTRYQRIVGELPPDRLAAPTDLGINLPASSDDASTQAIMRSPAISASIEMMRAARSAVSAQKSSYQPRVEARLRSGAGRNFDGVRDQRNDTSAEILLNWNLFNGGADRARVRQQVNMVNQAADLRDKACRDVRQTAAIAYNDNRKLVDQLQFLDRNTLAITKARDAYRQQFDIGQRSLLDLLNSENELYTARRSYANAEYDLQLARVRSLAAMQQLGVALQLTREEGLPQPPDGADTWSAGEDAPGRCPSSVAPARPLDTTELRERAAAQTVNTPVVAVAPKAPSSETAKANSSLVSTPLQRVQTWARDWKSRNADAYLAHYANSFTPTQGTNDTWRMSRRAILSRSGEIDIGIENLQATAIDPTTVETRFRQSYRSALFADTIEKVLVWKLIDEQWLIVRETGR